MAGEGVEGIGGGGPAVAGFGDEEGIAGLGVVGADAAEVREVDVGGEQVEVRGGGAPDVQHSGDRASARVLSGPAVGAGDQPRIGIHGQVVRPAAGGGDALEEPRRVPGHEHLVGLRAEELAPASLLPRAGACPGGQQLRPQRGAVTRQVLAERGRDGAGECTFGGRATVARGPEDARLVLDLHHEHGVVAPVHLADARHDGGEGAGVAAGRLVAEYGQGGCPFAGLRLRAGEAFEVRLDPRRGVAGNGVLQGAEPEEDQPHAPPSRAGDQPVQECEVEPSLLGFDQFPVEGRQDGVELERGEAVEDGLHVGQ
ncbi:MAG: hypothetical protein BWZ02_03111 [Lentisphaerae bacterium ADurb.BinA184]|nr:MAG: hypothetical protein BWZ02_03111 [Lentisphaerae bacterium ADurb.BinA184]